MAFHKITYNEKYGFATVHNWGCMYRCPVCSYKLRSGPEGRPGFAFPKPPAFLDLEACKQALRSVPLKRVNFMGGEPTVARELPALLDFCKDELGVEAWLGHTNGINLPLPRLDGANVGLKAWDEHIHKAYTGWDKALVFDRFAESFRQGIQMRANVVFVPGLVDEDQVVAIAGWLASLDPALPFHIMGYIPVPGQTYARPTVEQMQRVTEACARLLRDVKMSHHTPEEILSLDRTDDRFKVQRIA